MQKRITIFDTVRGFTMISMAGFHACYDLAYLYDWDMPWFTQTVFQDIWRASISWVFLFIAGWMCTLARQHQLGIFVYRGLDVHPFAQQYQTCRQIRLSSTRRLVGNNTCLSRRFS